MIYSRYSHFFKTKFTSFVYSCDVGAKLCYLGFNQTYVIHGIGVIVDWNQVPQPVLLSFTCFKPHSPMASIKYLTIDVWHHPIIPALDVLPHVCTLHVVGSEKTPAAPTPASVKSTESEARLRTIRSSDSQATTLALGQEPESQEIETPRRALFESPHSSEEKDTAKVAPKSSLKPKKKKTTKKPTLKSKKGKSQKSLKKVQKKAKGPQASCPKPHAPKPEVPKTATPSPTQPEISQPPAKAVEKPSQDSASPPGACMAEPRVKRETAPGTDAADVLGMLQRKTTNDNIPDEALPDATRAVPESSQAEETPPSSGRKKKRRSRDKVAHARRMRFYRSLDSPAPNSWSWHEMIHQFDHDVYMAIYSTLLVHGTSDYQQTYRTETIFGVFFSTCDFYWRTCMSKIMLALTASNHPSAL